MRTTVEIIIQGGAMVLLAALAHLAIKTSEALGDKKILAGLAGARGRRTKILEEIDGRKNHGHNSVD